MADVLINPVLTYTAFVTGAFDRTQSGVRGQDPWYPVGEMRTDPETAYTLGAASTAGDIISMTPRPIDPVNQVCFFLTHISSIVRCQPENANFAALFEDTGAFTTMALPPGSTFLWDRWDTCPIPAAHSVWNESASTAEIRRMSPPMNGFPGDLVLGTKIDSVYTWGGVQWTIGTYEATSAAASRLFMDMRWLGFPLAALKSGSFRAPQLYYRTGNASTGGV